MDDLKQQLDQLRLHTQADVHRLWELLMGPLGFGSTSLWICFVDEHRAVLPPVMQVGGDDTAFPGAQEVDGLFGVLRHVVSDRGDVASVAFLISHPGRGGLLEADRVLAAQLLAGAAAAGIPCEPVHVADDMSLQVVAPDDLAA